MKKINKVIASSFQNNIKTKKINNVGISSLQYTTDI